jgi:gamma-glutamyltranspeptidase
LILSPEYAEEIRERINEDKTQPLEYYEPKFEPQTGIYQSKERSDFFSKSSLFYKDHGTSHCSIIDAAGNAVAATGTINTE